MNSQLKTIAVFFGGMSVEHDVSILTGLQFIEALDPDLYSALPVYVAADGRWFTGDALLKRSFYPLNAQKEKQLKAVALEVGATHGGQLSHKTSGLFGKTEAIAFDLAVPAIHGTGGEDGALQGLLAFMNIPYSGCPIMAAAAAMDKDFTKKSLARAGVNVLPNALLKRPASGTHVSLESLAATVARELPGFNYPYFVKPRRLGSSVGVARANNEEELLAGVLGAFRLDGHVMIEPFVPNLVEYNIAISKSFGEMRTSAIERPVRDAEFLDFKNKYLAGGDGGAKKLDTTPSEGMVSLNRKLDPEELTAAQEKQIRESAEVAMTTLGLAGSVRIDFLCDEAISEPSFNEINTIPGSFAYYLWQGAKPTVSYSALATAMIEEGLSAHRVAQGDTSATAGKSTIFGRD